MNFITTLNKVFLLLLNYISYLCSGNFEGISIEIIRHYVGDFRNTYSFDSLM